MTQALGIKISERGFGGVRFRLEGLGCRAQGSGLLVCRVEGSGSSVSVGAKGKGNLFKGFVAEGREKG